MESMTELNSTKNFSMIILWKEHLYLISILSKLAQ